MASESFREVTTAQHRQAGMRAFLREDAAELVAISVGTSIDCSPLGDGSDFRPDPNGGSNREIGERLVLLGAQLLAQPIGTSLSDSKQ